eukprot:CAMPEP_0113537112 /NCGR_PEP_ID=MMETSP0015_2-20120614/6645_1 /TAXON_ID=2838 /ORGANISM="Odontella" /LENGTH=339 /DNA_ID=CAMNT_0000436571 /DNA_START=145 /DNA_END=1164 /DNA_ORIENTATION=- /assembly_acc=CAM_ASM_000160
MAYSAEAILLAVVPKFSAFLSICGSFIIVHNVIHDAKKRKKAYHRIMLGLSVSDIVAATNYFLGTWLIPRGTVGKYGPVYMAAGTDATCSMSGFFTQSSVASPLYNAMLALYYLFVVKYGWKEERLMKFEPLVHSLPIAFALGTSATGAGLYLYNSVEWLCWVNIEPPQANNPWRWAFLFGPVWSCIVFVTAVMTVLWWTMRQTEQSVVVHSKNSSAGVQSAVSSARRNRSKQIAFQGILYVGAFYITWFFPTLQRVLELADKESFFLLEFFDATLLPLQGLLNMCIYLRPRYKNYRKRNPEATRCVAFWAIAGVKKRPNFFSTKKKTKTKRESELVGE